MKGPITLTIILFTIFNSVNLFSYEPTVSVRNLYILEGYIDTFPITVYLTIEKDTKKVYGKYYYNKHGNFLYLENGTLGKKNNVLLRETIRENGNKKASGILDGTIKNNLEFSGQWKDAYFSTVLDFKVEPSDSSIVQFIQTKIKKFKTNNIDILSELPQIYNPKKIEGIDTINKKLLELDTFDKDYKNIEFYNTYTNTNDPEISQMYISYNTYSLKYVDNSLISLENSYFEYSGDAPRGSTIVTPLVYDLQTGDLLNEKASDLFYRVDDAGLIQLMREKLIKKADGSSQIYIDFEDIRLNDSFYVSKTGINFIFNQYEIAPYVNGTTLLEFTYDELKPFVKRKSKFWYLFD